jgi:subtilisin family serine protease
MTVPPVTGDAEGDSQFEAVRQAALERGIVLVRASAGAAGHPDHVYEKSVLLTRAADVDDVLRHLDAEPVADRGAGSVRLLRFDAETVPEVIGRLDATAGLRRDIVRPNHLVSVCPLNMCPADEPAPVAYDATPVPPPAAGTGGSGVHVDIIDTGLMAGHAAGHPWLSDTPGTVGGDPAPVTGNLCGVFDTHGSIREYACHGTFIAGVLRCAAPGVSIFVDNALEFAGAAMEDTLGRALLDSLARRPAIISLSAGGTTLEDRAHLGLEPFFEALAHEECTTLLVAAAGNDGVTDPFWPAAYAADRPDAVVSVGALRTDGHGRACFSSYGDWVTVFAAGEHFVNAFAYGPYRYVDPAGTTCRYYPHPGLHPGCTCVLAPEQGSQVDFEGMARWSGTSFSTPLVAGRIATHMTATGLPARAAAQDLLAGHTNKIIDQDRVVLTVLR